jgi:hypothetical protein
MPAAIEWTAELENGILAGIESGLTLRQVAEKHNISDSLILKKARENEEFCKQYARSLDIRTDRDFEALTDSVLEPPQETKFGVDSGWVAWKRVQIDTITWALSKRCPKKYGDKQLHTGGDGESAIEHVVRHIGADGE